MGLCQRLFSDSFPWKTIALVKDFPVEVPYLNAEHVFFFTALVGAYSLIGAIRFFCFPESVTCGHRGANKMYLDTESLKKKNILLSKAQYTDISRKVYSFINQLLPATSSAWNSIIAIP